EVWINRIVDAKQVRAPKNIADALANLCMLFAATVGEDDVKLFRYHVQEDGTWKGRIVEIAVDARVDFEWNRSNLDLGRKCGYEAADAAVRTYESEGGGRKGRLEAAE